MNPLARNPRLTESTVGTVGRAGRYSARTLLCGLLFATATATAGPSPEFTQLLNQLRKELDVLPASAAGDGANNICPLLAFKHGTDAMKDRLVRDTYNVVVVDALNDGIKFTASALGVGTIAIAAYDVARCAYDSDKAKEMGSASSVQPMAQATTSSAA